MKMRRFVGGVATVWFTCAVVGSPVLASTLPSVSPGRQPDQQLDQWLDRQADRTQPWTWAVGTQIESALGDGTGQRAAVERYVREAMHDWTVRVPPRLSPGDDFEIAFDSTRARLPYESMLRVALLNRRISINGTPIQDHPYSDLVQVARQRAIPMTAPSAPGRYTITVEASVGALLAADVITRNTHEGLSADREREFLAEVETRGAGPFDVKWTATLDVVPEGEPIVAALEGEGLAELIRSRVERCAIVRDDRGARFGLPLDVRLQFAGMPIPMSHDIVLRHGDTEVLVGMVRSGRYSTVECRSAFDEETHWSPSWFSLGHRHVRIPALDAFDAALGEAPRAIVELRPNPSHVAGHGLGMCCQDRIIFEDVPVITAEEDRAQQTEMYRATRMENEAHAARFAAITKQIETSVDLLRRYQHGSVNAEEAKTVAAMIESFLESDHGGAQRWAKELLPRAIERGDIDGDAFTATHRSALVDGTRLTIRERVRPGETFFVAPSGALAARQEYDITSAALFLDDTELWRTDERVHGLYESITIPEDLRGTHTLRMAVSYRWNALPQRVETIEITQPIVIVSDREPIVALESRPDMVPTVRDRITYGRAWIEHTADGAARAVVDVHLHAPTDVAYDVVLGDGTQEWTINTIASPAGEQLGGQSRMWWQRGSDVTGFDRGRNEASLKLVVSRRAAEAHGALSSVMADTVELAPIPVYHLDAPAPIRLEWAGGDGSTQATINAMLAELEALDTADLLRALRDAGGIVSERLAEPAAVLRTAHRDFIDQPDCGITRMITDQEIVRLIDPRRHAAQPSFGPPQDRLRARVLTTRQPGTFYVPARIGRIVKLETDDLGSLTRSDLPDSVAGSVADLVYAVQNDRGRRDDDSASIELNATYAVRAIDENRSDVLIVFQVVDVDAWSATLIYRRFEWTDLMRARYR